MITVDKPQVLNFVMTTPNCSLFVKLSYPNSRQKCKTYEHKKVGTIWDTLFSLVLPLKSHLSPQKTK